MRGGREVGAGRREGLWCCGGTTSQARHARGWLDSRLEGKGTRGAHSEHVAHVSDAGGVEAQRLVEGQLTNSGLPRVARGGAYDVGGEVRAGRRGCVSEPDANGEHGTRLKAWGPGQARGAHVENMPPMAATACGARLKAGGQGRRAAHHEHGVHGRDAGGVEAQRLVEGPRLLPSRREGMRCDLRLGGQGLARSARRTCCSWS